MTSDFLNNIKASFIYFGENYHSAEMALLSTGTLFPPGSMSRHDTPSTIRQAETCVQCIRTLFRLPDDLPVWNIRAWLGIDLEGWVTHKHPHGENRRRKGRTEAGERRKVRLAGQTEVVVPLLFRPVPF